MIVLQYCATVIVIGNILQVKRLTGQRLIFSAVDSSPENNIREIDFAAVVPTSDINIIHKYKM